MLYVPIDYKDRLCLGFIGSGQKFCTKVYEDGQKGCGVSVHEANKFVLEQGCFYIRTSISQALCSPALQESGLTPQVREQCLEEKKTTSEWISLFDSILASTSPQASDTRPELKVDTGISAEIPVPLESPALVGSTIFGLFPSLPVLTLDSSLWENLMQEADARFEDDANHMAAKIVQSTFAQFMTTKQGCDSAFAEMEGGFTMLVKDVNRLSDAVVQVTAMLGTPKPLKGALDSSIWGSLTHLHSHLSTDWELFQSDVRTWMAKADRIIPKPISDKFMDLQELCEANAIQIKQHAKRFDHLRPFMEEVRVLQETVRDMDISALSRSIRQMSTRIQALEDNSWDVPAPVAPSVGSTMPIDAALDLSATVSTMQEQLKLLEKRVVGKGVSIGTLTLQSFEDCMAWVTQHIPPDRWGLFVDGVSLFEFMDVQHTEVHDALQAIHNSKRSGFASLFESRVAVSMSNLLPTLFGKSSADGLDTSEFLPALQNPDKWDLNGVTGLKHNLERGMVNVTTFMETSINRIFRTHDKARQLALECLMRSKRFIQEMINFMTNEFSVWKHRGYSKSEAWRLTCICVRRVFESMYAVRVTARDMPETSDKHFVAASMLWSTIAAHEVMEDYMKLQFLDHPTISAVISRHLASHHVKSDDQAGAKLKKCEELIKNLQSKIDKLETTVKQLANNGGGNGKKNGKKGQAAPEPDEA